MEGEVAREDKELVVVYSVADNGGSREGWEA